MIHNKCLHESKPSRWLSYRAMNNPCYDKARFGPNAATKILASDINCGSSLAKNAVPFASAWPWFEPFVRNRRVTVLDERHDQYRVTNATPTVALVVGVDPSDYSSGSSSGYRISAQTRKPCVYGGS